MRKIESQMISAIYHAKAWKNSNTHTEIVGNTVRVFLHGNLIATLASSPADCGRVLVLHWGTSQHFSRTTFSRQNAILRQLVGSEARVFTKAHQPTLAKRFGQTMELEVGSSYEFSLY